MEITYSPNFIRLFNKLENSLQDEVVYKINIFTNKNNHQSLQVHKLKGRMKGLYSFSVNYRYRIVFEYISDKKVYLESVGDHNIYK